MGIIMIISTQLPTVEMVASLAVVERASQSEVASSTTVASELWGPIIAASSQPSVVLWFLSGLAAFVASTFLILSARRRARVAAGHVTLTLSPASH